LKKNIQHNGQKKKGQKDKQQSTKYTHKTKDRVTRTPLKTGVNSGAPEGYAVPAPLVAPVVIQLSIVEMETSKNHCYNSNDWM
jgi:hypothetical protein